jgi:hypothetical protein
LLNNNGFTPFELSQILLKVLTLLSATIDNDDHAKSYVADISGNKIRGRQVATYFDFDVVGFLLGGDVLLQYYTEDGYLTLRTMVKRESLSKTTSSKKHINLLSKIYLAPLLYCLKPGNLSFWWHCSYLVKRSSW